MRAARRALRADERDVGGERGAAGRLADAGEQERRDRLGGDALRPRRRRAPRRCAAPSSRPGSPPRRGIGLATSWPPGRPRRARMRWARAIAAGSSRRSGAGRPAVARPEGGERVLAEGDHRHAAGLEHLERLRQVEDRLGAAGDDGDRGLGELLEVGGDVEARLGAAVHAADAAGGEDLDAGEAGADHRRGDGGRRRSSPRRAPRRGRRGESLRTSGGRGEGRRARSGSRPTWMRAVHHRDRRRAPRRRRGPRPRRRGRSRGSPATGMPWVMIVDSSATSGRRAAIASATSAEKASGRAIMAARLVMCRAAASSGRGERSLRARPSARAARCAATKASPAPVTLRGRDGRRQQGDERGRRRRPSPARPPSVTTASARAARPTAPAAAARLSAKRRPQSASASRAVQVERRAGRRAEQRRERGELARARRHEGERSAAARARQERGETAAGRLPSTTMRPGQGAPAAPARASAGARAGALEAGAVGDRGVQRAVRRPRSRGRRRSAPEWR